MMKMRFSRPIMWSMSAPVPASMAGRSLRQGTPEEVLKNPASLTAKYLTGEMSVRVPDRAVARRRRASSPSSARGATT